MELSPLDQTVVYVGSETSITLYACTEADIWNMNIKQ